MRNDFAYMYIRSAGKDTGLNIAEVYSVGNASLQQENAVLLFSH